MFFFFFWFTWQVSESRFINNEAALVGGSIAVIATSARITVTDSSSTGDSAVIGGFIGADTTGSPSKIELTNVKISDAQVRSSLTC
jgi:hypothetical protein